METIGADMESCDPTVMTSAPVSRRESDIPLIVLILWDFWLPSNYFGWFALRQSVLGEESIERYRRVDSLYLVTEVIAALSDGLAVLIVREINRRQTKNIGILNSLNNIQNDSSISGDNSERWAWFSRLKAIVREGCLPLPQVLYN